MSTGRSDGSPFAFQDGFPTRDVRKELSALFIIAVIGTRQRMTGSGVNIALQPHYLALDFKHQSA